jgi:hypothetical protein
MYLTDKVEVLLLQLPRQVHCSHGNALRALAYSAPQMAIRNASDRVEQKGYVRAATKPHVERQASAAADAALFLQLKAKAAALSFGSHQDALDYAAHAVEDNRKRFADQPIRVSTPSTLTEKEK